MLVKQTTIDRIEIDRNDDVSIRLAFEIVDDGNVISQRFHRFVIKDNTDPEATIADINAHLSDMNQDVIAPEQADRIRELGVAVGARTAVKSESTIS